MTTTKMNVQSRAIIAGYRQQFPQTRAFNPYFAGRVAGWAVFGAPSTNS
jgi:hypothetical protein